MAKEKVSIRKKVGCSIGIAIAVLLIIFAFCGRFFNSGLKHVANFFVGSFGMAFYGIMIAVIVICSFILAGKKIRIPKKYVVHFVLLFVELVMLVHLFTTTYLLDADYATYAHNVYNYYSALPTFGGIVFGIIVFSLTKCITIYATSVLLFALLGWSVYMVGDFFYCYFTGKLELNTNTTHHSDVIPSQQSIAAPEVEDPQAQALRMLCLDENSLHPIEVQSGSFDERQDNLPRTPEEAQAFLFQHPTQQQTSTTTRSQQTTQTTTQTPVQNNNDEFDFRGFRGTPTQNEPVQSTHDDETTDWRITQPTEMVPTVPTEQTQPAQPQQTVAPTQQQTINLQETLVETTLENDLYPQTEQEPVTNSPSQNTQPDIVDIVQQPVEQPYQEETLEFEFDETEEPIEDEQFEELLTQDDEVEQPTVEHVAPQVQSQPQGEELIPIEMEEPLEGGGTQVKLDFRTDSEIQESQKKLHKYPRYIAPPIELFNDAEIVEDNDEDFRMQSTFNIINKLSVFGIKVESAGQIVGPTVTRYMFKVLSLKTKMSDFNQYAQDLKACLEATGDIIIQAPIPGTNLVGFEVANKTRTKVCLRSVLDSKSYREKKGALVFVVGQEISGEMVIADLAKLPHLLVAGTTGSGKSVFLHSLIASLIYRYGPEYLRFIMVDPKLVEFSKYNGIPHMLTKETINDPTDALAAMDYLIAEMEARYKLFQQVGAVNIIDYNAKINPKLVQKLPYLVLIVDELADLMSVSQKSFDAKLQRLAQKARAAGIHLVLATQRPDTKVISGTIKTNFACRVALKVASPVDSNVMLGSGGAEKLLGNGDMLFMREGPLTRIQGVYLADDERDSLVDFVKAQNESYYEAKIYDEIFVTKRPNEPEEVDDGDSRESRENRIDPYCKKALHFWLERNGGRASIASIQRALKVGFNRAGGIVETLQRLGYVEQPAPSEPSTKPLKVLVGLDDLDKIFPDLDD